MALPFADIVSGDHAALIRGKARRFAQLNGMREHDREDLAQDLFVHAFERAGRFDRGRGSAGAYLAEVIKRKLAHMREARYAQKRDVRRARTANALERLVDRHPARDYDLRIDLSTAIGTLPKPERLLAAALTQGCLADAARILGISRTRSRRQLARIRRHFIRCGIDQTSKSATTSRTVPVSNY